MPENISTQCCITGGGPAGVMLGFLLARAGVDVAVLEKHADFFRDFRGDTIHASTLELMHELGLLASLLELPHQEARHLGFAFGATTIELADFSHLPTRCKFIALMPQWDFLNFLAQHGAAYPTFSLHMATEATDILEEDGRIVGVRARSEAGELTIRAGLCVAADGRHSTLRERAAMQPRDFGAPMDVLWFKLARAAATPDVPLAYLGTGQMLVLINRGEHWQCGYVIPKGGYDTIRAQGLEAFRRHIVSLAPFLAQEVAKVEDWAEVKLLAVQVDRLEQWWRPGLLCIGDAAHAMSPVAGVGVNLAVQDAVAAANLLAGPLRDGGIEDRHLQQVQQRRQWPAQTTQRLQQLIQNKIIAGVLKEGMAQPPWVLRLIDRLPALRRIPSRLIGLGLRPEHIAQPDVATS